MLVDSRGSFCRGAMESLYLSLTALEDRYRELSIMGDQHFKLWQDREAELAKQIADEKSQREAAEERYRERLTMGEHQLRSWQKREAELLKQVADQQTENETFFTSLKAKTTIEIQQSQADLKNEYEARIERLQVESSSAISAEISKRIMLEQELKDVRRELSLCFTRLGQIQDELAHSFRLSQSQAGSLDKLGETLSQLTEERNRFMGELDEIRQSSSWRLTKPVRRLFDRIRLLRR